LDGNLLVRVRAAGLNRADYIEFRGAPERLKGRELAGEVIEVGPNASSWSVGDRVMALGAGFSTEPVLIPQDLAIPVPDSFSWEEAGALPLALCTMHDAIVTNGQLARDGRVVMHAATSGVGITGVQLSALYGASVVYATSRSAKKLDTLRPHLRELDSDLVLIDTSTHAFEQIATEVDLIVDNVGASVLEANIKACAVRGRIVQVGRLGGAIAEINLDELARKRIALVGVTFRTRTPGEVAEVVQRAAADTREHLASLTPRIERVWPVADLQEALTAMGTDSHVGKIVVTHDR
jgi:NADPH:quinone reductase-like Zn-dependent oxidoreductase